MRRSSSWSLRRCFVGGPVAVWLYAAIRPRFGAGPRTALIAALWLRLFSAPYVQVVLIGLGLVRLVSLTQLAALDAFSLIPITAATLVGAWLYKEDDSNLQSQRS